MLFTPIKGLVVGENVGQKKALIKRRLTFKKSNEETKYAALQVFAGITDRREAVTTKAV